jgi:hypothetical protein
MNRKQLVSKASLAGKLSAATLAIGAMAPMLSACSQNGQNANPSTQQAPKAGPSNPCAPQNSSPANPCAPQAAPANPCAPQADSATKKAKKDCEKASNPCAPAPNCDDSQG